MERALTGWKEIADFLSWSEYKVLTHRDELENAGVVFYCYMGRPPTKRVQAFPSAIMAWTLMKAKKKEVL